MNVLLLGSGGREHALAWKLSQSPLLSRLYIAPGNPGTTALGENVDIHPLDFPKIAAFCRDHHIEVVLIGPEEPLVRGIADFLKAQPELGHLIICGPGKDGARLEGSKAFSKEFMLKHKIPTAAYRTFSQREKESAKAFIQQTTPPFVLKVDGLAAGKGVIITADQKTACETIDEIFGGAFGSAGNTIVIEQFLSGIEFSVFILTNGEQYLILPEAKDYKRIGEGDTGLNTGGMGAVSPVPFVDTDLMQTVKRSIIEPTLHGLKKEGINYCGFIFFGLILTSNGPQVIEYNCRMGDPETEVVMLRWNQDLLKCIHSICGGNEMTEEVEHSHSTAMTVMMVSEGYPGSYPKGRKITGIPDNQIVFHAGTNVTEQGDLVTAGGRVLACSVLGRDIEHCRELVYPIVDAIHFDGANYRKDIGCDLM